MPLASPASAAHSDCDRFWAEHVPFMLSHGCDTTLPDLNGTVSFRIGEPGDCEWSVVARAGRIVDVARGAAKGERALVSLSAEDFSAIARGTLDHREPFFAGRIRIDGDIQFVLWAANLIPLLRERFPFHPVR